MKVLIVGSGGREHAIGLKLTQSPQNPELHFAPGNPGMELLGDCYPVGAEDISGLLKLCQDIKPDLVIVGPEVPLVLGLADELEKMEIPVFGPSKLAARLEGSKAFSKDFMKKYKIPTAAFENFTDYQKAKDYLRKHKAPIVIKASGLAAGKGAVVCMTDEEAAEALDSMLGPNAVFGEAGQEVVIEEFMQGEEASLFVVSDGKNFVILPTAQDHKRIFDGDKGPNTGGMGAYSPAPIMTADLMEQAIEKIVKPSIEGMANEGCPYLGVLYIGLMIHEGQSKVVEYNCRFGDPEAQVILPIFKGDLLELVQYAVDKKLDSYQYDQTENSAAIVVMSSEGYPGSYSRGYEIEGIDSENIPSNAHVIHAGTKWQDGKLVTSGGRVLGVVGSGDNLEAALNSAYAGVECIEFKGAFYRKDIGQKGLKRLTKA